MKNLFCNRKGVSEIVGTMLLLGIAVILFSVVYFSLLSTPTPTVSPAIDMIAGIEEKNDNYTINIEHRGGESIDVDSRFFVEIAGIRDEVILEDLVQDVSDPAFWDFGEQIKFNVTEHFGNSFKDLSDLQIDVGIADVHSNSLLLLNTLQEGYRISSFGWGGIWHFDENGGNKAYDSTGNENHGSILGTKWHPGIHNSCLSFNGLNDNVYIPSSLSLEISENLTLEAWINASSKDDLINISEFDGKFGYNPDISHVVDDIYAVVYRNGSDLNSKGVVKTISIGSDGWVTNVSLDRIFSIYNCNEPKIISVSEDIVAIAYGTNVYDGVIETFNIDSNGEISALANKTFSNINDCIGLSITQVQDSIFAIAYGDESGGYVQTVELGHDGSITLLESGNFDNKKCIDPNILHLREEMFVISYTQGKANKKGPGLVCTVNISSTGDIFINDNDYSFSPKNNENYPSLAKLSEDIIVLVYNDNQSGILETIHVDSNGIFSPKDNLPFYENSSFNPYIQNIHDNIYLVAFEGKSHEGIVKGIKVNSDGSIDSIVSSMIFAPDHGYEPVIFKISDTIFGVVYRDKSSHPGSIRTFTYLGSITNPSNVAGIFKKDAFGLYANETHLIGSINGEIISISNFSHGWNHVVMTYDKSYIRLFVNGTFMKKISYTSEINTNNNVLNIGKMFFGCIDEVGLYGHILTSDEIFEHYTSPGSLN